MKKNLLLLISAFCFPLSAFPQSAPLAAELQTAAPAHWPAIEALLKAQRAELVAAQVASLKTAAAQFRADLAAQDTALKNITAERDAAQAEATRLKDLLAAKLAAETKTGKGPKTALLEDLLTEAAKPAAQAEVEALEAERDAVAARLKAAKAKLR